MVTPPPCPTCGRTDGARRGAGSVWTCVRCTPRVDVEAVPSALITVPGGLLSEADAAVRERFAEAARGPAARVMVLDEWMTLVTPVTSVGYHFEVTPAVVEDAPALRVVVTMGLERLLEVAERHGWSAAEVVAGELRVECFAVASWRPAWEPRWWRRVLLGERGRPGRWDRRRRVVMMLTKGEG